MRYATTLETAAAEKVAMDLNLTAQRDDKSYLDIADGSAKPKVDVKKVKKDFLKTTHASHTSKLKPGARSAIRNITGEKMERLQPLPQDPVWIEPLEQTLAPTIAGASSSTSAMGLADGKQEEPQAMSLHPPELPMLLPADMQGTMRKRKYEEGEDVPRTLKRTKYQDDPAGVQQLPLVAMNASVHSQAKEWFDKFQNDGMSMLLNKVVRGVHVANYSFIHETVISIVLWS